MTKKLAGAILILLVLIFGMICFFAGYYIFETSQPQVGKSIHLVNAKVKKTIPIVAVDQYDNGVISNLTIEIGVGEGRALVNIDDVLANYDTQRSARYAMAAASDYLQEDLSYTDVIFSIESSAELVSGPSAGAAMAAALIASLKNADLNESVMLTGTIYSNGRIGQVGGVLPKAKAVKEYGAALFLIPPLQSNEIIREPVIECKDKDGLRICDVVDFTVRKVDVAEEANISVIEIANIADAMGYLLV